MIIHADVDIIKSMIEAAIEYYIDHNNMSVSKVAEIAIQSMMNLRKRGTFGIEQISFYDNHPLVDTLGPEPETNNQRR